MNREEETKLNKLKIRNQNLKRHEMKKRKILYRKRQSETLKASLDVKLPWIGFVFGRVACFIYDSPVQNRHRVILCHTITGYANHRRFRVWGTWQILNAFWVVLTRVSLEIWTLTWHVLKAFLLESTKVCTINLRQIVITTLDR